jgi:hypothetical protein
MKILRGAPFSAAIGMLKHHQFALGFLVANALWAVVFVLQSDASAYYQICEANQYTGQEHCTPHHLLFIAVWYIGYVVNPTSVTALATIAIAWFTWTLKESTDRLWEAGADQLALSRDEFIAAHRPKIIIHAVDLKRFLTVASAKDSGMDNLGAILLCVNKGRTSAVNIEIRATTMCSANIPDAKIQRPIIKTVESLDGGIKIWTEIDTGRGIQELISFNYPMYLIGTIAYFDQNENRRETGFGYVFGPNRGWEEIDGKTYNYAY